MGRKRYNLNLKKNMTIGDQYLLIDYIDEGSYGYVWKATRLPDGKVVALKIPKNQEKGDMALTEGKKLMGSKHEHVIEISWMGRVDGVFVIEMEYFKGYPLTKELSEEGHKLPRTIGKMYELFSKILDGVEYMHDQNLVHGDLKPDNILVHDNEVKLTDFGTSRLVEDIFVKTVDGVGTWAYMAPEVAGSKKRYLNSDIYSLGVILYQFLTGRTPHDTFIQVLHNVPFARPRELNPNITIQMEKVILKALERDPEHRYRSISDFRTAFSEAVQEGLDTPSEQISVPVTLPKKSRDPLELAIINCRLKKYSMAEKILMQEIASGNKMPELLLQQAYVYFKTDRLFKALDVIESIKLKDLEESRQSSINDSLLYLKAQILFELKQFENALRAYENLYQNSPENIDYRYRLAICYGICGFEGKAIELLEAINKETPGIWAVVKKLGLAYDQKKEHTKARGFFKYALTLRPNDQQLEKRLEKYEFYL